MTSLGLLTWAEPAVLTFLRNVSERQRRAPGVTFYILDLMLLLCSRTQNLQLCISLCSVLSDLNPFLT